MIWHCAPLDMVIKELGSNISTGLTENEAAGRLEAYGKNELDFARGKALLKDPLERLGNILRLAFLLAAVVSVIFIKINGEGSYAVAVFMVILVFVDFLVGLILKLFANRAVFSRFKSFECSAKVLRDGKVVNISSKLLVPGDIIMLETGDLVPADARIIRCNSFRCDESILTGEDFTVNKDAGAKILAISHLNQRYNMVYSRCAVVSGNALAIVTETGANCEINRVATSLGVQGKKIDAAIKSLSRISRFVSSMALFGAVFVFFVGLIKGMPFLDALLVSFALALVAVPKDMLITLRSVFSGSLGAVARKGVVCKGLPQVEVLSGTTVFCLDRNLLLKVRDKTFKAVSFARETIDCSNPDALGDRELVKVTALFRFAVLCCDDPDEGDAVDSAIVRAARTFGVSKQEADLAYPRVTAAPFDRARRMAATINIVDGEAIAIVKGAVEEVLPRCERCDHAAIEDKFNEMASKGLQVIAVAFRKLNEAPTNSALSEVENGLTFAGLMGFADSFDREATGAISELRRAGIKTVLLSGDSPAAAAAVARKVGISNGGQVLESRKLTIMTDEELVDSISNYSVFARVTPADKLRIVRAFQQRGEVVLLTSNGAQDISALQRADIGCALGRAGSDIERSAADIVVEDDRIVSVAEAIFESRGVFDRIKRVAQFKLSTHIAVLTAYVLAMIFWNQGFLSPLQLLIAGFASMILGTALRFRKVRHKVGKEPPKGRGEPVFPSFCRVGAYLYGLLLGGAVAGAYIYGGGLTYMMEEQSAAVLGTSAAFVVLFFALVILAINLSAVAIRRLPSTVNPYLIGAALLVFGVVFCGMFFAPAKGYFEVVIPSNGGVWARLIMLSALPAVLGRCLLLLTRPFSKVKN